MAEQRVLAELERLLAHVEETSLLLRSSGRPDDAPLVYASGALEVLRRLELISDAEFEEWSARAHHAAGGHGRRQLIELTEVTTSVSFGRAGILGRLRRRWRSRREARALWAADAEPLADEALGSDPPPRILERAERDRWWNERGRSELGQILYWRWDPIGVADAFPVTADEYDDYLQPLLEELAGGAGPPEIERRLAGIERRMMGGRLTGDSQLREVASLIGEWYPQSVASWRQGRRSH